MSDKIGDDRDPYLYPGLNVMRNKLNVRQAERLAQAGVEVRIAIVTDFIAHSAS